MAKQKEQIPKNQDWLDLCEWLEINIFDYDIPNQRLQTPACLVLMGLTKGQEFANNDKETHGCYPYNVILMAFKLNKNKILKALKGKDFKNKERQKMSYICAIVKDSINDVYTRYVNMQKIDEKIDYIDTSISINKGAEYKKKETKINPRLEGLW